jgi:hypothetical protein
MIKIVFFSILLIMGLSAHAQTDELKVTEVIHRLFDGMHKADSALVRSVFGRDATLATPLRKEGKSFLLREDVNDFIKSISRPQPEPLSEEIWDIEIQIDGDFAQVWCDYAFYVGNRLNHCGVDAFHLYRTENGWKIFHLADTRRKEGCNVPEEIREKHK